MSSSAAASSEWMEESLLSDANSGSFGAMVNGTPVPIPVFFVVEIISLFSYFTRGEKAIRRFRGRKGRRRSGVLVRVV